MKLLLEILQKHLKKQNETYLEHMFGALRISFLLFFLSIRCFIHSFIPFLFMNAVSSRLDYLNKIVRR